MDVYPNHTKRRLAEGNIAIGMRFILSGNDTGFLMAGARARAYFLHGLKV